MRKVDLVADAVRPAAAAAAACRRFRLLDGRGGGRGRGLAHYGANFERRESAGKGACNFRSVTNLVEQNVKHFKTYGKVDKEKLFSPLNIHFVQSARIKHMCSSNCNIVGIPHVYV